jgi:hypothetical protein
MPFYGNVNGTDGACFKRTRVGVIGVLVGIPFQAVATGTHIHGLLTHPSITGVLLTDTTGVDGSTSGKVLLALGFVVVFHFILLL